MGIEHADDFADLAQALAAGIEAAPFNRRA